VLPSAEMVHLHPTIHLWLHAILCFYIILLIHLCISPNLVISVHWKWCRDKASNATEQNDSS